MALILLFIIVCIDNLFSDASVILIFLNFDQNIEPRFLINLTFLVTQRHMTIHFFNCSINSSCNENESTLLFSQLISFYISLRYSFWLPRMNSLSRCSYYRLALFHNHTCRKRERSVILLRFYSNASSRYLHKLMQLMLFHERLLHLPKL